MVVIITYLKVLNVNMVTVEISYGSGKGVPQKDDRYEPKHPTSLGFVSEKMMCAKSLLSCPTLCDPMDCSLPGSSVHGILQARILEWDTVPSSRGSSGPRD